MSTAASNVTYMTDGEIKAQVDAEAEEFLGTLRELGKVSFDNECYKVLRTWPTVQRNWSEHVARKAAFNQALSQVRIIPTTVNTDSGAHTISNDTKDSGSPASGRTGYTIQMPYWLSPIADGDQAGYQEWIKDAAESTVRNLSGFMAESFARGIQPTAWDIKNVATSTINRSTNSQLRIPVPYEHDPDSDPEQDIEREKTRKWPNPLLSRMQGSFLLDPNVDIDELKKIRELQSRYKQEFDFCGDTEELSKPYPDDYVVATYDVTSSSNQGITRANASLKLNHERERLRRRKDEYGNKYQGPKGGQFNPEFVGQHREEIVSALTDAIQTDPTSLVLENVDASSYLTDQSGNSITAQTGQRPDVTFQLVKGPGIEFKVLAKSDDESLGIHLARLPPKPSS
ncbi:uncharacterized protein IL334_007884 [Kwoniella shivajii]|uniref:Uncharacterized protein n=1 Tax=Kwoniella shivajii TaxID=564305 RepID=A0ABZ1D9V7_9TREE|nr:hypothetical protein IL334_007884 [Kwoniella shivajii]